MQAVAPGLAEVEVVAPDSVKQAGASRFQVQEAQAALPEASTFTSAAQVSLSCCSSHNQLWCRIDVRVAGCRAHAGMWQCRHVAVQACAEGTCAEFWLHQCSNQLTQSSFLTLPSCANIVLLPRSQESPSFRLAIS